MVSAKRAATQVELGAGVLAGGGVALDRHAHVLRLRGHLAERETHGVRAVGGDDVQGIHAVAQRLGHLAALAVLDHGVDEHVLERGGAGLLQAGFRVGEEVAVEHHHAGDPQRDDLAGGGQDRGGVEGIEELGEVLDAGVAGRGFGVGPAHGGQGPERAGEPGVEDVGILHSAD
jgi:hypothetical protein